MKLRANGITINYELAGEGDCLVLIHGAGDNLRMWLGQVPAFARQYKVLTYDIRGFGETECPKSDMDVSVLAADLRELFRALGIETACVLGFSMGGRIALQLAVDEPSTVKALILSGSAIPAGPPPPEAQQRRRALIAALERGELEAVAEQMTELSFSPGLKERNPALFERFKQIKLSNNAQCFARVWKAMAQSPPPDPARLACPVLLIAGAHDAFVPLESMRNTQAMIPGSRLEVLPTGHAAALEAPDQFNRIVLDFLAEVRRKESAPFSQENRN
jgi:pimeloyl-ACP methyl ester carboxylesterase